MKTYGSTELQRLAKVSKMQAIHWTQVGAVIPYQDAKGRGSRRVYSWQNLIEMMICRELNRFTIETHVMVIVLLYLRNYYAPDQAVYLPNVPPPPGAQISFDLIMKGARSFWDMLEDEPNTDHVYLYVHPSEKPDSRWAAGVWDRKTVARVLEIMQSIIVINIRELIKEVKEE